MARQPRFGLVGYPQHVIQRGNNRQACFFVERDYTFYLEKLADACAKHGCDVHAYVLMTNHVHLLVTPHATDSVNMDVDFWKKAVYTSYPPVYTSYPP